MRVLKTPQLLVTIALVNCFAFDSVLAQTQVLPPQFMEFIRSKPDRDDTQKATRNQIASWNIGCTDIAFDPKFEAAVQQPIQLSSDGRVISGAWTESFFVTACGVKRRHHVFVVLKDKEIYHLSKLVGTSMANYQLQQDPAEVGLGMLDWRKILPACVDAGVEHYYVEQEPPFTRDRFDSMRLSHDFLARFAG